jgi:hypothetical protein
MGRDAMTKLQAEDAESQSAEPAYIEPGEFVELVEKEQAILAKAGHPFSGI